MIFLTTFRCHRLSYKANISSYKWQKSWIQSLEHGNGYVEWLSEILWFLLDGIKMCTSTGVFDVSGMYYSSLNVFSERVIRKRMTKFGARCWRVLEKKTEESKTKFFQHKKCF